MNANVYTACYVGAGAFLLFMAHLIRTRLKAKHPQIYTAMHALCLVTVLGEVVFLVLYAYQFAVVPLVS